MTSDLNAKSLCSSLHHIHQQNALFENEMTLADANGASIYLFISYKNRPMPASFYLFSSFSHYNFNNTIWKKHRWCARYSNPRLQDGRRRRIHWAMVAAPSLSFFVYSMLFVFFKCRNWPILLFLYFSFWQLSNSGYVSYQFQQTGVNLVRKFKSWLITILWKKHDYWMFQVRW